MKATLLFFITISMCWSISSAIYAQLAYPPTKKVNQVDEYHGTKVEDPYRWLEDDNSPETKAWVEAQNKVTQEYLSKIPYREKIKNRLSEIWNYPRYSAPFKEGGYYFFYKNDGLQNQSVLYFQKTLSDAPQVALDPNTLSADGTVALGGVFISPDGKYMGYSVSKSGSDWQTLQVMEWPSKKKLTDEIQWAKFTGMTWHNDGFYYSRFDEPAKGSELSAQNEYQKIYYHKIGTPQSQDKLVYEDKQHPKRYFGVSITDDKRFLLLSISEGAGGNEALYYKDLTKDPNGDFKPIVSNFDNSYSVVDNIGDKMLVMTNHEAPRFRLVMIDPAQPAPNNWKVIIPQKEEVLKSASLLDNKIFATFKKDVADRVYIYDLNGKQNGEVKLPDIGTVGGFGGKKEEKETFYVFTSFTYPPTIFRYDVANNKSELYKKSEVKFKPEDYETKQVFFTSKDGAKVPMFIVHKKGLKLDGKAPTLMYGYGGFNISLDPSFSVGRMVLLENGGIYAHVNLRGGSEYGEDWHKAGMLLKKQNVFNDFIAAAEYLIKERYTSSEYLAIQGGSNGGLLVGAAMCQRPELFKVAFPAVGVMDMLRYHKFTIGWGWISEYGSSEDKDPAHFKNLYGYSPLHNLKAGTHYPATMVMTADHDDRVVPAHSFKFAATLQEKHKGKNPVLIRIDVKAGHGAGKPVAKVIEEVADVYSFMFHSMGFTPKY